MWHEPRKFINDYNVEQNRSIDPSYGDASIWLSFFFIRFHFTLFSGNEEMYMSHEGHEDIGMIYMIASHL